MEMEETMPSDTREPKHCGVPCQQQCCCENKSFFFFFIYMCLSQQNQAEGPNSKVKTLFYNRAKVQIRR